MVAFFGRKARSCEGSGPARHRGPPSPRWPPARCTGTTRPPGSCRVENIPQPASLPCPGPCTALPRKSRAPGSGGGCPDRGWCGELSGTLEPCESPRSEAERGWYAQRKGFDFPMLRAISTWVLLRGRPSDSSGEQNRRSRAVRLSRIVSLEAKVRSWRGACGAVSVWRQGGH